MVVRIIFDVLMLHLPSGQCIAVTAEHPVTLGRKHVLSTSIAPDVVSREQVKVTISGDHVCVTSVGLNPTLLMCHDREPMLLYGPRCPSSGHELLPQRPTNAKASVTVTSPCSIGLRGANSYQYQNSIATFKDDQAELPPHKRLREEKKMVDKRRRKGLKRTLLCAPKEQLEHVRNPEEKPVPYKGARLVLVVEKSLGDSDGSDREGEETGCERGHSTEEDSDVVYVWFQHDTFIRFLPHQSRSLSDLNESISQSKFPGDVFAVEKLLEKLTHDYEEGNTLRSSRVIDFFINNQKKPTDKTQQSTTTRFVRFSGFLTHDPPPSLTLRCCEESRAYNVEQCMRVEETSE